MLSLQRAPRAREWNEGISREISQVDRFWEALGEFNAEVGN